MNLITEKNYKKLMIIPIILVLIALVLIFIYPGLEKGIDLKGGNQLIMRYPEKREYQGLDQKLSEVFNVREAKVSETVGPTGYGLLVEYSHQPDIEEAKLNAKLDYNTNLNDLREEAKEVLKPLVENNFLSSNVYTDLDLIIHKEDLKEFLFVTLDEANTNFNTSIITYLTKELDLEGTKVETHQREVAAVLGKDFVKSSIYVGLIAFALLILVILLFFKKIVPSSLIILSSIFNIFIALGGMVLFNLPLSLTTIPALLMLIGYSVDTNILLSSKVLKERTGSLFSAINESMSTGLFMTFTTLATVVVMIVISYFTQMYVVLEIATVLFFGLSGDVFSTWFFNGPILATYVSKKEKTE